MQTISLTVVGGPNDGVMASSPPNQTPIVGRGSTSDFTVMDPRMSREHFRLATIDGDWFVQDLGSSNGTSLNGDRIDVQAALCAKDVIVAGDTKFVVEFGTQRVDDVPLQKKGNKPDNRRTWKDMFRRRKS